MNKRTIGLMCAGSAVVLVLLFEMILYISLRFSGVMDYSAENGRVFESYEVTELDWMNYSILDQRYWYNLQRPLFVFVFRLEFRCWKFVNGYA